MKLVALLLVGLLAGGCALYKGTVTAVSKAPVPAGLSFAVASRYDLTGEGPAPSATEEIVRQLIAGEMRARGYLEKPLLSRPDLVVTYGYGSGEGETSYVGSTHLFHSDRISRGVTLYDAVTRYPRWLDIAVMRVPPAGSGELPVILWRSELNSSGTSLNVVRLGHVFIPESFRFFNQTVEHSSFLIPAR